MAREEKNQILDLEKENQRLLLQIPKPQVYESRTFTKYLDNVNAIKEKQVQLEREKEKKETEKQEKTKQVEREKKDKTESEEQKKREKNEKIEKEKVFHHSTGHKASSSRQRCAHILKSVATRTTTTSRRADDNLPMDLMPDVKGL
ncbi:unnamed protein product [Pleuronectes platessa]|uniref:Uncharacterized protein n=1 Tax=Pleuronectes platessa TaxID=8262 RepID=A0A9N7YTE4_PLEPL|nr:unnamed protein product [Pleuronectes platessa]